MQQVKWSAVFCLFFFFSQAVFAALPTVSVPSSSSSGSYTVTYNSSNTSYPYFKSVWESTDGTNFYGVGTSLPKTFNKSANGNATYYYKGRFCTDSSCSSNYWSAVVSVNVNLPSPTVSVSPTNSTNGQYTVSHNSTNKSHPYFKSLWESVNGSSYAGVGTSSPRTFNKSVNGTYSYKGRFCTDSSCSNNYWSSPVTVNVSIPNNTAPNISNISSTSMEAASSETINFTVSDAETSASSLSVSASSSNPSLIPVSAIVLSGNSSNRSVTLNPVHDNSGSSTITLTVSDGSMTDIESFILTVTPLAPPVLTLSETTSPDGRFEVSGNGNNYFSEFKSLWESVDGASYTGIGGTIPQALSKSANGTYSYKGRFCSDSICSDEEWTSPVSVNVEVAVSDDTLTNHVLEPQMEVDASISTFDVGSQKYWLIPSVKWETNNQVNVGPVVSHALVSDAGNYPDELINSSSNVLRFDEIKFFEDSGALGISSGHKWITNTYGHTDGILAFVHAEWTEVNYETCVHSVSSCENNIPPTHSHTGQPPGHSKIGLAWYGNPSTTSLEQISSGISSGPVFKYLGHIASNYSFPNGNTGFNVHGTPYVVKNELGIDYFYMYMHDYGLVNGGWGHVSAIRAPLSEVIQAAKLGTVTDSQGNHIWEKYNGGVWSDALGGQYTATGISHVIVHGDAAYSTFKQKYYLVATTPGNWQFDTEVAPLDDSKIVLYESSDALNWNVCSVIASASGLNDKSGWQYPTIVDSSGDDNSQVGSSFNIYARYQVKQAGSTPSIHQIEKFTVDFDDGDSSFSCDPSP